MELWIRSQDNYEVDITPRLIKANDIFLDYCGENDSYYILVNNGIEVAYYSSEKRALEVLDEIQKLLKPQIVLTKLGEIIGETCDGVVYSKPNEYDIKGISTCVYEMPNE